MADRYSIVSRNAGDAEFLPETQWAGPQGYQDDPQLEGIDPEKDVLPVLDVLNQRQLQLTEHQREALKDAEYQTFEKIFAHWNTTYDFSEDEEERVKDFDENHRLERLWTERHGWANWALAVSFHVIVIVNFLYCIWESFGILVEDAKFKFLYLEDVYQCLDVVPSHDSTSHFVSIFHAATCVAVLHAKTMQTADLCWAFLFGTTVHACFKVYELLFNARLELNEEKPQGRLLQLIVVLCIQLIAFLIILQRYYDLTGRFQQRSHKFVTLTYEGRQLNDRIIYRNVSSFVQRKYVLRSCTALQIYNTVQKLQHGRRKLKKGEAFADEDLGAEVNLAVTALKEVEGFRGMDMMRELKRRNYERMKDEYVDDGQDPDALDDAEYVDIGVEEATAAEGQAAARVSTSSAPKRSVNDVKFPLKSRRKSSRKSISVKN